MDINEILDELKIDKKRIQQTFSGNIALYKKFLLKFADDSTFNSLCEAVQKKDSKAIEMAAHTLKGVAGNLGLDSLSNLSSDIVSSIRSGNTNEIPGIMEKIKEEYNNIVKQLKDVDK